MNEMYNRIEKLCEQKGVNITQMCRDADVPRGNLTDLKKGRTSELSTKSLGKLAVYFGVSIDYFLGEQKEKPADQKASGLRGTGYDLLTPAEKAMVDSLIEQLLALRSKE